MKRKEPYLSPQISEMDISVESGFAQTGGSSSGSATIIDLTSTGNTDDF